MCIPGAINNINMEGVYKLLKDGATMVTNGQDILNALNWEVAVKQLSSSAAAEISINDKYLPIYNIVSVEPKGFDEIQSETGLSTDDLLIRLTEMELHGLIKQVDGDRYGINN